MALMTRKTKEVYLERVTNFRCGRSATAPTTNRRCQLLPGWQVWKKWKKERKYLGVLADLIEGYESRNGLSINNKNVSAQSVMKHLMSDKSLTISGLAREIGIGSSNLSEMLSGRRDWSKKAIRGLCM